MDAGFTPYLVWLDISYIELPFQFFSVGKRTVQQYDPISSHSEGELGLISSRLHLFRFREQRTHARVGHVGFDRDMGPGQRMG